MKIIHINIFSPTICSIQSEKRQSKMKKKKDDSSKSCLCFIKIAIKMAQHKLV